VDGRKIEQRVIIYTATHTHIHTQTYAHTCTVGLSALWTDGPEAPLKDWGETGVCVYVCVCVCVYYTMNEKLDE
jgi:hypothetical protein